MFYFLSDISVKVLCISVSCMLMNVERGFFARKRVALSTEIDVQLDRCPRVARQIEYAFYSTPGR
jgi:hypothetical protein